MGALGAFGALGGLGSFGAGFLGARLFAPSCARIRIASSESSSPMPYTSASSYGFSSRSICAMSAAVAASGSEAMGPGGWRRRVRVCPEIDGLRDDATATTRISKFSRANKFAPAWR